MQTSTGAAPTTSGLDPESLARVARNADDVIGYLEVHIEQGPVLELEELPLGVVTAIAQGTASSRTVSDCGS